jgi:GNAT superfamily N-acetyltransferase
MIPLRTEAIEWLLDGEPVSHRSTALRHASIHQSWKLRGDHPDQPSSAVWLRPGDSGWEAFAAGEPDPALDWLKSRARGEPVALLAPESWYPAVLVKGGSVERATVLTMIDFDLMKLSRFTPEARVLTVEDGSAFEAIAPSWALRSWNDFGSMIEKGMALGLFSAEGLVSLAWTYESEPLHDKIGVATSPAYRRLGLGRRVAGSLLERIVRDRAKAPIWVTTPENKASLAMAKSLGFANPQAETLLRWTPNRG